MPYISRQTLTGQGTSQEKQGAINDKTADDTRDRISAQTTTHTIATRLKMLMPFRGWVPWYELGHYVVVVLWDDGQQVDHGLADSYCFFLVAREMFWELTE